MTGTGICNGSLIAAVLIAAFGGGAAAAPCLPVTPRAILDILPGPPEGWELKRSEAAQDFSEWLICTGVREYVRVAAEGEAAAAGGQPFLRIRITDTARHPEHTDVFADWVAGEEEEGSRNVVIQSFPAIITDYGKAGTMVDVFVEKRFIVNFLFRNEPPDSLAKWLAVMDLAAMRAAPGRDVAALPKSAELSRIDELRPKRNSSWEETLLTAEADEKRIAEDDRAQAATERAQEEDGKPRR